MVGAGCAYGWWGERRLAPGVQLAPLKAPLGGWWARVAPQEKEMMAHSAPGM